MSDNNNFFNKIGEFLAFLSFLLIALYLCGFLLIEFMKSVMFWIKALNQHIGNLTMYLIILSLLILFSIGIIFLILGEITQLFFKDYPNLLLPRQNYTLQPEERDKISVIIPAYNEEKTIVEAISSVSNYCKNVIVIDDGSTDETHVKAKEAGAIVVTHKINQGLGQTLRDGIKKALSIGSEIIINFDADMQYRATDIPDLVYYLLHDDYDIMMGSRLAGKIEDMALLKKIGNKIYTRLLQYLTKTGVSDGQTGFRAFTDEFASIIKIRGDFTYTQEMILEAATKKFRIGEIPIHFDKRKDGNSRLMRTPIHFAKSSGIFLLKILIDIKTMNIYFLFSSVLIVVGFYIGGNETLSWLITMDVNTYTVVISIMFILTGIIILSLSLLISTLFSYRD